MTKIDAIEIFGSLKNLRDYLCITDAAIAQWQQNEIPKLREFQIKESAEYRCWIKKQKK